MKVMELKQYINGKFHTPVSGKYMKNRNPATGDIISKVPLGDKSDVDAAVYSAKSALPEWSAKSVDERAEILEKIANIIESRKQQLAELESLDTGKPIRLAFDTDISRAIANFRFFAGAARHDELGFHKMKNAVNYTLRKPLGVVALITPWNLPIYLLSWKTAPALVMGNTVVAKPSSMTPLTASALAEIMNEAGLPNGVFNLVHGSGSKVGKPLSLHQDIAAVSFTGSTNAGAKVSEAASSTFKKISLELGGKNPTIVFADADLKNAINGTVRAAFTNQGQVCLCGSRILVERKIHDQFLEGVVKATKKMKIGNPSDKNVDLGAVISHEHRDKVEEYIRLGIEEGGRIECGGKRPELKNPWSNGAFLEPTIISGLSPNCRTATEEIFGPVATIHPFETEEEAVAISNSVNYGLAASVWTSDLSRAHRISADLESGMVWVNTWLLRDLRVPFGGMKDSGVGREGGRYSLDFFSELQNVCIEMGEKNG